MPDSFKIDFTGLGSVKAGTTWIAKCLSEHPQICLAPGKELNYFLRENILSSLPVKNRFFSSSHYELGPEWYESRYESRKPGQLCGEFSNAYLAAPECADLLFAHNPRVKLIVCFRNPMDMVHAAFYQISRIQDVPDTLEEMLAKYPQLLRYGKFYENLQPFLRRFPREQLHFLLFDDIKQDAPAAFRGICRFLGVDETIEVPSLRLKINPRVMLRSKSVRNFRGRLSAFMSRSPGMKKLRTFIFRSGLGNVVLWIFQLNEKAGKPPPMSPEARAHLTNLYRDDIQKLQQFLGRDLSGWLTER